MAPVARRMRAEFNEPLRALFCGRAYNYAPTAGLIFAFDSISLEKLAEQFADWSSHKDIALIPDGVRVLDKGHLL